MQAKCPDTYNIGTIVSVGFVPAGYAAHEVRPRREGEEAAAPEAVARVARHHADLVQTLPCRVRKEELWSYGSLVVQSCRWFA